ncbi:MAG: Rne/Rng family ribonuclease [Bacteroidaceae bacterium]|nr:Rne/Rng family ribonuclease [Bacteroidaceae bacterium]
MTCEVIVDVQPKKIAIALTEDKRLVEYQEEELQARFNVGNIYYARVRKLMPGLNACFVNVGHERDAFLHYQDLGPQFNSFAKYLKQVGSDKKNLFPISKATIQPEMPKEGSVQNTLQLGQELLVQIVKEPISTKGPRLTCEITFPGRFLVLVPFTDKVHVSSKIKSSAERARLKQLIQQIKPKNFGVIVRTVAEGKRVAELDTELMVLLKRWEDAITRAQKAKDLPTLCYEETSRTVALLRDLFNPTYQNIYINDARIYDEVRDYVQLIAPEMKEIVKLYKGKLPIFDNYDVTRQIKTSFGKTVSYKHGAYLIIEHTEALHVVDVNSGNRAKNADGQEANALEVNLGAADELARQLRLRDMGGIIVVDFIDMNVAEDRQKLYERMVENMKRDRARHNILPLSKFGLMQITRQRVRPVMEVRVDETCPTCMGKGTIKSSFLFTDVLEEKIAKLTGELGIRNFVLHVHPYVAAYINQGLLSIKRRWQMKYGFGVRVMPNQRLAFLQYEFYSADGEEIDMRDEDEMSHTHSSPLNNEAGSTE